MQENQTNLNSQNGPIAGAVPPGGIVSTLAGSANEPVRSLAEMAQRDLDAALQLLADRAQYITGASGAAIALRRDGRNDMLCRASAGSNAPELGALLSAEYGLSGESVRTRRLLRCDDAERDSRVNREVCRQLGIASVVVMPVVHDDEVLGVFELFSGRAHAFGERDLSAVERLSGMVETAVRLARVTQELPEKLRAEPASPKNDEEIVDEDILEVDVVGPTPAAKVAVEAAKAEVPEAPKIVEVPKVTEKVATPVPAPPPVPVQAAIQAAAEIETLPTESPEKNLQAPPSAMRVERPAVEMPPPPVPLPPAAAVPVAVSAPVSSTPAASPEASATRKPMFWSAAAVAGESAATLAEDQSNVPPILRGLRKCEACGFPISGGRVLCVECEEKKWRGQLRKPQGTPMPTGALPENGARKPEAQALAAVATGSAAGLQPTSVISGRVAEAPRKAPAESGKPLSLMQATVREPAPSGVVPTESSSLIFSAGLEPSQSWIARNKYVLGVLVLVAAVIAAIVFLR